MKTISRVWRYGARYKWFAIGTFACAVIATLSGLVLPQATQWIIDDAIKVGDYDALLPLALLVAGAFLARDVFNSIRIRLNNSFEQRVIFDLRSDLYDTLQRLPLGWYDNRSTGDVVTRVEGDVADMERVLIDGIEQGLVALLQAVIVGVILFLKNWWLALLTLLPMPLLAAGAAWFTFTAHRRWKKVRAATSAMNSLLVDNVQGVRQIKSYARERREFGHFQERARTLRREWMKVMHIWATYNPSMMFFTSLGSVIVLYFGGLAVMDGEGLTEGEFVSFLLYVGMFYEPIGRLHQLNQLFQQGRAAGDRVFEVLDTAAERYEPVGEPAELAKVRGEVVYEDVGFAYREDVTVLDGINITARPGETLALVGHTGAGKSTIINLLLRFYETTRGRITIDGVDIARLPLMELRRHIGLVSQESFLFNGTVRENLLFGRPGADEEAVLAAAAAANAHGFISALPEGYDTNVGERGVKLSVGEKQRISIARALLKDPPILILDEATASVDTATEQLIQSALNQLLRGRTSFVIAHRLSTIRHADQILVMRDGQVAESGRHEELLATGGIYAHLCSVQGMDRIGDTDFERIYQEG
ncbi:MAG: ABC transporter ATP-binding protein [Verrucomicrobiota bacterium]